MKAGRCTHYMQEQVPSRAVGAPGGQGGPRSPQFWQINKPYLNQEGGKVMVNKDYAHHITNCPPSPPWFSDLPTALAFKRSYEEKKMNGLREIILKDRYFATY